MKPMKFLAAGVAVVVLLVACSKDGLFNNHAESRSKSRYDSSHTTQKDTCIRINGKDSCFKIYWPSDSVYHGGPYGDTSYYPGDTTHYPGDSTYFPKDSTYYPGGGKDTCIKRNGKDSCFKWPAPIDSSSRKR